MKEGCPYYDFRTGNGCYGDKRVGYSTVSKSSTVLTSKSYYAARKGLAVIKVMPKKFKNQAAQEKEGEERCTHRR